MWLLGIWLGMWLLGMWLDKNEGSKFWLQIITELKDIEVLNNFMLPCVDD